MTRRWLSALIVLTMVLISVAGSLVAGNESGQELEVKSTTHGGTLPPVKVTSTTPIAVKGRAPMDVVNVVAPRQEQHPDVESFASKAPVNPGEVETKAEGGNLRTSMTGVSKLTLYLDKQPPSTQSSEREAKEDSAEKSPTGSDSQRAFTNPCYVGSGQINNPIPDQGWLWQRVIDTLGQAPAGAVVTNLEYRTYIGPQDDPSNFYCGDYEIHLFTGTAERELMIYDNLGGRTDGGYDDDAADDGDIYLNHRNTHYFDGDDALDFFGIWIDDVYSADYGQLNYIEFWVYWEAPLPNLTCYAPGGWDSAIVVSSVTGTNTADSLTGGEPAYIDWSVINNGPGNVVGRFYTALYIDGNYITQWFTDDLGVDWYTWVQDYSQTLDSGDHQVCIYTDYTGAIAEEDEGDNSCCFTYHWYPLPPDLHCYSPGWDGPIVVSAERGTSTQDTVRLCDTAFVDWAVGNSGGSPTQNRYYVRMLIDGVPAQAWYVDAPHVNGYYVNVIDYAMLFSTAGTHTVSLEVDYTGAEAEGDETNNTCEVATVVVECLEPDVACYTPDGWDGPIIVSAEPGTNTQSPITAGDPAYIDFAVANIGDTSTAVDIYHTLYVDGDSLMTWFSTPIAPGDWRWAQDYSHTFATAGPHTVSVFHDKTEVVDEPDEENNFCEYVVNVQAPAFVISGHVHDPSGTGIPDVAVMFHGIGTAATDGGGFYEQLVPSGWSDRVTPSKACLEFLPPYRDYAGVTADLMDQNYEGSVIEYLISGYVLNADEGGIGGVEMLGFPGEILTDETGYYAARVPCGWSGTVTPTAADCGFLPPSRSYVDVQGPMSDEGYSGECAPPGCDPGFEVAPVTGAPSSFVGVGIQANSMQSSPIGGLEFHLSYPTGCLTCSEVVSNYLTSPTVNCSGGEVHIVWDDFANPVSVPHGEAIASIVFEVVGETGNTCEICWMDGNEVVNPTGDPIPGLGYCCGSVIVTELACGDVDGNQSINLSDVVYIVGYIFGEFPPPDPLAIADVDCSSAVNISDVVYLVHYIFGGPEPCAACP
jgi:hypothetical protein